MSDPAKDSLRSWAEIDTRALKRNARTCREVAGNACEIMAVVKADAYGHGAIEVARAIQDEVDGFGVANAREAMELKTGLRPENAGCVLMLGPALESERAVLIENNIAVPVSTAGEAEAFDREAGRVGATARIHAVTDTGMGRMGVAESDLAFLVSRIRSLPNVRLEGVASHLPSADEDSEFTRKQISRFRVLVDELSLDASVRIHIANSAGLFGYAEEIGFTSLARPGLAIYGVSPLPEFQDRLKPALSLKTRITLVRELPAGHSVSYGRTFKTERSTLAATLGIGYGDGYPRSLSGQGANVLIAGKRCPLMGRVTMDQIVVDVSNLERPVHSGDEAVLVGTQDSEEIPVGEIAEKAGTIPWEIFTGITGRVGRIYV